MTVIQVLSRFTIDKPSESGVVYDMKYVKLMVAKWQDYVKEGKLLVTLCRQDINPFTDIDIAKANVVGIVRDVAIVKDKAKFTIELIESKLNVSQDTIIAYSQSDLLCIRSVILCETERQEDSFVHISNIVGLNVLPVVMIDKKGTGTWEHLTQI